MITVSALNALSNVRHGFFTRNGGVSEGLFRSLNCGYGSGDDPKNVEANRAKAVGDLDLPPEALITVRQEHTSTVIEVTEAFSHADAPTADALVTKVPRLALGILTADCAPVLLADGAAGVIGAAHAGWKGALAGVLENTVAKMVELGADKTRIVAGIGPCIAQRSYEVGPDFPAPFLAEDADNERFFSPSQRDGHHMFDLPGYVARKLARLGVGEVMPTPCDTVREDNRFFSYRRATLAGESDYGRMVSAIALER